MREYKEVRKALVGEGTSATDRVGIARLQLGILKEFMAFNKLLTLRRCVTLADGTLVEVASVHGQDSIKVVAPSKEEKGAEIPAPRPERTADNVYHYALMYMPNPIPARGITIISRGDFGELIAAVTTPDGIVLASEDAMATGELLLPLDQTYWDGRQGIDLYKWFDSTFDHRLSFGSPPDCIPIANLGVGSELRYSFFAQCHTTVLNMLQVGDIPRSEVRAETIPQWIDKLRDYAPVSATARQHPVMHVVSDTHSVVGPIDVGDVLTTLTRTTTWTRVTTFRYTKIDGSEYTYTHTGQRSQVDTYRGALPIPIYEILHTLEYYLKPWFTYSINGSEYLNELGIWGPVIISNSEVLPADGVTLISVRYTSESRDVSYNGAIIGYYSGAMPTSMVRTMYFNNWLSLATDPDFLGVHVPTVSTRKANGAYEATGAGVTANANFSSEDSHLSGLLGAQLPDAYAQLTVPFVDAFNAVAKTGQLQEGETAPVFGWNDVAWNEGESVALIPFAVPGLGMFADPEEVRDPSGTPITGAAVGRTTIEVYGAALFEYRRSLGGLKFVRWILPLSGATTTIALTEPLKQAPQAYNCLVRYAFANDAQGRTTAAPDVAQAGKVAADSLANLTTYEDRLTQQILDVLPAWAPPVLLPSIP